MRTGDVGRELSREVIDLHHAGTLLEGGSRLRHAQLGARRTHQRAEPGGHNWRQGQVGCRHDHDLRAVLSQRPHGLGELSGSQQTGTKCHKPLRQRW